MQWLLFLLWVVPRYTFLLIQPHYWLSEYFSRYKGVPRFTPCPTSPRSPLHTTQGGWLVHLLLPCRKNSYMTTYTNHRGIYSLIHVTRKKKERKKSSGFARISPVGKSPALPPRTPTCMLSNILIHFMNGHREKIVLTIFTEYHH